MRSILISLLLLPSLAEAREWHVAGGAAVHVVRASSFDAVSTSDAFTQGELSVGVEEDLEVLGLVDHVGLDLRWSTGSTSATDFGLVEAGLAVHDFQLGLSARHTFFPWLGVYARGALGLARAELSLSDDRGDSDWAHVTQLGLGGELSAHAPGLGLDVGLRLEAGLATTGDFAFVAGGGGGGLETRPASLGDVDLDGLTYRFVAFGRF